MTNKPKTHNTSTAPKPERTVVSVRVGGEDRRLFRLVAAAQDQDVAAMVIGLVREKAVQLGLDQVPSLSTTDDVRGPGAGLSVVAP